MGLSSTCPSNGNLGNTYSKLGNHNMALKHQREAHTIFSAGFEGYSNPVSTAAALLNLGVTHGFMGKHEKALEAFKQAEALYVKEVPPDHPHLARARQNIAQSEQQLGLGR